MRIKKAIRLLMLNAICNTDFTKINSDLTLCDIFQRKEVNTCRCNWLSCKDCTKIFKHIINLGVESFRSGK